MDTSSVARIILDKLTHVAGPDGASLEQMRVWFVPQKAENDDDYSINKGYFELILAETLSDLVAKGYVISWLPDGVDDGEIRRFSLTEKGAKYVKELSTEKIEYMY